MVTKKLKPIVICGFCKSGTTAITKCLAHCLRVEWQNEVRAVWHIDTYATKDNPQKEIHARLKKNKKDKVISLNLKNKELIKFPQAIYVPDLIVPQSCLVVIARHPADTICAYLERKHEFKTLKFSWSEVQMMSKKWNYAYLSLQFVRPKQYRLIRYEDFILCPEKVISSVCSFTGRKQKMGIPNWHFKQALPYFHLDKKGRPVRGVGRSKLSLTKEQTRQILTICQPAIKSLAASNSKIIEYLKSI